LRSFPLEMRHPPLFPCVAPAELPCGPGGFATPLRNCGSSLSDCVTHFEWARCKSARAAWQFERAVLQFVRAETRERVPVLQQESRLSPPSSPVCLQRRGTRSKRRAEARTPSPQLDERSPVSQNRSLQSGKAFQVMHLAFPLSGRRGRPPRTAGRQGDPEAAKSAIAREGWRREGGRSHRALAPSWHLFQLAFLLLLNLPALADPRREERERALAAGYRDWIGTLNETARQKAPPFPGARFYFLHSLSHLLLAAISLECGYAASAPSASGSTAPRRTRRRRWRRSSSPPVAGGAHARASAQAGVLRSAAVGSGRQTDCIGKIGRDAGIEPGTP
jgi:hypothetical protein